jgi:hypothetical protein
MTPRTGSERGRRTGWGAATAGIVPVRTRPGAGTRRREASIPGRAEIAVRQPIAATTRRDVRLPYVPGSYLHPFGSFRRREHRRTGFAIPLRLTPSVATSA